MIENPTADIELEEQTDLEITEPNLWRVIMLNDDKTTMDFVVGLLVYVFHKDEPEAIEIMLRIHAQGQAIVGLYTHEVAEEKVNTCIRTARAAGFPLQVIMEEDT
jgi:ATP-dependent Clp protease adaptor protein ClpS